MTANVRTIDRRAPLDDLISILDSGLVAVVSDSDGFHGIITRIDVLNFLRKEHSKKKERA
jgi:cystathionine beta-synthase